LSGPASGLVITSTPAGRFVYWPDRKPADLISGDSCYIAYIDSLPFQEGTPLAQADSNTPTEVAPSESSLGTLRSPSLHGYRRHPRAFRHGSGQVPGRHLLRRALC
jgi:hypothetical protein